MNTVEISKSTERLEAFSDAVIAIAMTLLVLDIKVPHIEAGGQTALIGALLCQWHSYLSFAISFIFIGLFWTTHHDIFKYIKRVDHVLLLLNLLFLMFVAIIPFSTGLLAEYIESGAARTAALVYIGTYILAGSFFNLMWWYAAGKFRLIDKSINPQILKAVSREHTRGIFFYIIAFCLAFLSVFASLIPIVFLAFLFVLPRLGKRHAAQKFILES